MDSRVRSLSRVLELTIELLNVKDVSLFLKRICESVREFFGFDLVSIAMLDEERGIFTDHATAGYTEAELEEIVRNPWAFTREEILGDMEEENRISKLCYYIPVEKQKHSIDSFVNVRDKEAALKPRKSKDAWHELDLLYFALLNRHGDIIGYMQVDYPRNGLLPSREVIESIELFAGIAAVAVENHKMYKRAQDLLQENDAKTARMYQLFSLIQSVLRVDDLDVVLQKISDALAANFGFRKTSVSLFTEGSDLVTIHALTGYTEEEARVVKASQILKHKILEDLKEEFRVTRTGYFIPGEVQGDGSDFVFIEDRERAKQKRASPDSWHELDLLYFGIYDRGGKMIGYIQPDYPIDGRIPTKETMEAMEAFAAIASIAIENCAMFKDLNRAKDQVKMYLDLLTHDIGNMVNPIDAYLDIVLATTPVTPVQRKYLSSARETTRSIMHLIRNVRRSAEMLERPMVDLVPVNLTKSIQNAAREAVGAFLGKRVNIRVAPTEHDVWVIADDFLEEVLYNLFTNAIKYDQHEEVVIDVDTRPAKLEGKDFVQVRIVDRGIGIPDELKEKIFSVEFRKLAREQSLLSSRVKGAGMGLSIVRSLVERYGGKVWVENRVCDDHTRGSVFNLLLATP